MNRLGRRGARLAPGALAFLTAVMPLAAAGSLPVVAAGALSPARLSVDSCVPVPSHEVDALLALELDRNNPASAGPEQDRDLQVNVNVDCVGDQLVRLTVERAGARRRQRAVRLYDVPPNARTRLLALGIVELIVSSGDAAASGAVTPTAADVASTGTPPPPVRWRIDAGASMRVFTKNGGQPMWGGTARITHLWPGTHSAAAVHVAAERSDQAASLGRVTAVVASAALCYHLFGERGRWHYGLAPGLRVGWARLAGAHPATEVRTASFGRWWAGPILAARLDAALGARVFAGAGLEIGKVLQSVRGVVGGQTEVELGGVWLSAMVAVGLRL